MKIMTTCGNEQVKSLLNIARWRQQWLIKTGAGGWSITTRLICVLTEKSILGIAELPLESNHGSV